MRPENLESVYALSQAAVSPSGEFAVVSAKHMSFAADAYVGQLWWLSLDSEDAPTRITRGFSDGLPKFSPDGSLIGFLRSNPGEPAQLAIVSSDCGEPLVITDRKLGVTDFAFSEDSQRIYFISPVPEEGRYGTLEGVAPTAEDPREITNLKYMMNGEGWINDKRRHVFVIDIPDPTGEPPIAPIGRAKAAADKPFSAVPEATQLTSGPHDFGSPVATAGGVLAISNLHESFETDLRADVYLTPDDGGTPTLLSQPIPDEDFTFDVFTLVDDTIYAVGHSRSINGGDNYLGKNPGVWHLPLTGGVPTRVTDEEEWYIAPNIAPGDGVAYAVGVKQGSGVALEVSKDGIKELPEGEGVWAVHTLAYGGGTVLATVATDQTFDEVVDLSGDEPVVLTDFSAGFRAETTPVKPNEITATSFDGYPVHGWSFLANNYDPEASNPVLLLVHGGPFAWYGPYIFDETQIAVEAGYTVLLCNPRGSASYGQKHGQAISGDFGNLDHKDIIAFLDYALETIPGLDPERVGVMGGSYGGYMTAWLLGHETRFKGGIVERGYLDPKAFVGSSDIGWFFSPECHAHDEAKMDAQSPTTYVKDVVTPTLIIQSEQDLRCPIAQALRYYTELKLNGVDAELLVFPGETHELTRSGRPIHRKVRFEKVLDWWERHLPVNK
jgi:dipeptidyl aminopeptidase/acylaminoacyl peptidase